MATSNNSSVTLIARGNIRPNTIAVGGGKGGVSNYELLTHKPSINGHELIGNKTNAELGIPTDTQDLTNTAGFITKLVDDLVNYYTKLEIDDIINQIKQSSFRIVDDLPLVGDPGVIYLILNSTPQSRNYYDEYIYIDSRWEKIGTTEIDLSGYVTDEELTQVLRNYITNETLNETLRNYYNKADVNLLLAGKVNSADLAAVATSGSYNDLQNKPDIPDDLADLNEDTTHRTVTDAEKIAWNNKSDFSGSYNDLTDKPTIPDELADLTDDTTHRLVTDTEKSTWNAKSDFSGSYNDLTDKPDIPTVYNSTITIQKNNQNIDSFTLNQSSNKSINMSVPEKTSDIQNDSGFITNTVNNLANYYLKSETYTKTEVSNLINAAVSGRFQKVNALPAQGEANVIYLVPKATVLVDNVYDEYIWEDDSWELIGDTQIDLSGYVTDADLTAALQNYVTSATFNTTISNYYTKTEVSNLLADKVDKVDGKGLSTYDYDAAAKAIVDSTTANLATKVDKVDGKGLSSNDYTTADKNKLAGIAAGAEVNVQSDWSQTNTSSDDFIKNKPTKVSQFANDSGFTKVESSETNGNIKIDTVETVVYDDAEIQEVIDTSLTETDYANPLSLETMQAQHAKNTKIKLEPIQDLHGYDKPWVGGAGKNKCPISSEPGRTFGGITFTNNYNGSWTIDGDATTSTYPDQTMKTCELGILPSGKYTASLQFTNGSFSNTVSVRIGKGSSASYVGSGYGKYTFTADGTSEYYLTMNVTSGYSPDNETLFIQVEEGSTATSYEPYTNICPISGHDQIDILGCGKNLVSDIIRGYPDTNNMNIASGNGTSAVFYGYAGMTVRASATTSDRNALVYVGSNKPSVGDSFEQFVDYTLLATLPKTGWYCWYVYSAGLTDVQVEKGEQPTEYEPYQESTDLSIDLPSTVYGGVLDLESGELVVEKASVDLSDYTWTQLSGFIVSTQDIPNIKYVTSNTEMGNGLSEKYQMHTATGMSSAFGCIAIDVDKVSVNMNDKTYQASGQFCYELATPITIQLTPHQLSLLKAQNNLTTSQYTQIKVIYRNGVFATLEPATDLTDGLMSAMDKLKLDNIVPATTTTDGLMSATDKTKLDGIADDATKTESSTTNGNIKINGTETQVYDDSEIKGELSTDTTTIEGNPLNFTTLSAQNAKSTILSCEPIQDLHGYDKPWVGGAGKNLVDLNSFTDVSDVSHTVSGNTINISAVNKTYGACNYGGSSNLKFEAGTYYLKGNLLSATDLSYVRLAFRNSSNTIIAGIYLTTLGNFSSMITIEEPCYFSILVSGSTALSNSVSIDELIISTTDVPFEPYENICPISGRTEIGILGCGRNLCDEAKINRSEKYLWYGRNGQSYIPDGSCILDVGIYTISLDKEADIISVRDSTGEEISRVENKEKITFTNNVKQAIGVAFVFRNESVVATQVQIELGETPTTYSPYTKSNDLTISLGQTVYGGTLDVENGLLNIDGTYKEYSATQSMTSISYGQNPCTRFWLDGYDSISNDKRLDIKCNLVPYSDSRSGVITPFVSFSGNYPNSLCFQLPTTLVGTTEQTIRAYLADTPVNAYTPLATPITINLTPHTINLLKGVNNISTDGDKITLTYRDGSVATLGDLTSAVDNLDSKIDESKILTDTATGDKYILVVTNGVLSVEQVSD